MKISIVIPNYNGEKLLQNNFRNILDSGVDEVIIVDDASMDKSLEVLNKFQITNSKSQTNMEFKILKHNKNMGFISSANELFNEASGDIVVLLNNDVYVEKDFIGSILKHFEDEAVFAVNLHEKGEGPAVAFWKDGFFEFKRGDEKTGVQKSAWASGGSAAYRKSLWKELWGFDPIFAPFYWEDIDISYRALKKGYEILWEPNSKVKHEHETTIKKFNQRYVRWVRERNQLLFIWKNISDPKLKSEHRKGLLKRLLTKPGYWVPFLWALFVILSEVKNIYPSAMPQDDRKERSDLEVINYAN